jgi:prolipoprotein diacylglyceryltransferase
MRFFKKEGLSVELLDKLTIYMAIGTVIGARLGHCLFYEPEYYLKNPLEILKIWRGGLASHGAAIGILVALFSWFLILVFGMRFLIEFIKEDQVDFELGMALNMGQWLSIPFVMLGIALLIFYRPKPKKT